MRLTTLMAVVAMLGACAEGQVEPLGDAGTDGSNNGGTNNGQNNGQNNGENNGAMDMADPCGECCPGDRMCQSATETAICRADGSAFDVTACPDGQVCMNGGCEAEPLCMPMSKTCKDDDTVLTCRGTGDGYAEADCEPPLNCFQGNCVMGAGLGASCAADDECASMSCRCGSGTDDMCPATITNGYCSSTCTHDSCGELGRCFAGDIAPLGNPLVDVDNCVRKCDPTMGGCGAGLDCKGVPVRTADGVEWDTACYYSAVSGVGQECTSNATCLAGNCRTDYFQTPFCTRRCDEDGECGPGAACVELNTGEFWCSPICGDGSVIGSDPCPLDVPVERFDVTCRNLGTLDGGVMRVCATP